MQEGLHLHLTLEDAGVGSAFLCAARVVFSESDVGFLTIHTEAVGWVPRSSRYFF